MIHTKHKADFPSASPHRHIQQISTSRVPVGTGGTNMNAPLTDLQEEIDIDCHPHGIGTALHVIHYVKLYEIIA